MSKLPLPELIVSDKGIPEPVPIVVDACKLVKCVGLGKKIKVAEEIQRKKVRTFAEERFDEKSAAGEYIGLISIESDKLALPVRVEWRLDTKNKKAIGLDASEGATLDGHFGIDRPSLFELCEVVDTVVDPPALIKALTDAGLNPWDYLELNVRDEKDAVVIEKSKGIGITTAKAYLPRENFIAIANRLSKLKRFTVEAAAYLAAFIKGAFKPTVVVGSTPSTGGKNA